MERSRIFNKGKNILVLFFIIALQGFFSCESDDSKNNNPNEIALNQVLLALGGESIINNANTISYKVDGSNFEFEQEGPTVEYPINGNNHSYTFTSEMNTRKVKIDYSIIEFQYPFVYSSDGSTIIINNEEGQISGKYNWSSYYLGRTESTPLYSSRIEAILKNQKMANPIELVKDLVSRIDLTTQTLSRSFSIPTIVGNLNIKLVINEDTNLPEKAIIMETDFINGDVFFEVVYEDWITTGNLKYPSKLMFKYDGNVIKTEVLSNIEINPILSEEEFELGDGSQLSYNLEQARYGVFSSQWYHRLLAGGIPIDQPLNNGALVLENFDLSPFGMLNQTIGENVKIIGRPDSSNWPVAIKTSSGIHLVEAPLSPRWTRSVINAVQNEFPGEDMISVIPTHTHYDHFGGIREIAAEVDKIYIPENSRTKLENALSSKHTLVPDAFSNNSNMPLIENVTGITYIDNGAIEIHLLKLSDNQGNSHAIDNSHSEDIVVVYVPEYNVLIQADFLYAGIFLRIWNNEMVFPFTGVARTELSQRAEFLVNYIGEKNLNVDTIIGIHGGKCTMEDLINVAQN